MDITKNLFRKIVLLFLILTIINLIIDHYLNTYELDDVLFKGYYQSFIDEIIFIIILFCMIVLYFLSIILIYFFKPIGKSLYLYSLLLMYLISMFLSDEVYISLLSPLESFTVFLEFFILYIMYFTSLKNEFNNKEKIKI